MADGEGAIDQDHLIALFQEFTGLQDVERSRSILETRNWSMEMAVQDTFNEQEGHAPVYGHMRDAVETNGETSPPPVVDDYPDVGDFAPVAAGLRHRNPVAAASAAAPPALDNNHQSASSSSSSSGRAVAARERSWWQWCADWLLSPVRTITNSTWLLARFLFSLFTGTGNAALLHVPDPEGDVRQFAEFFQRSFADGAEAMPNMLRCSYAQAIRQAKEELKFLVVYCHVDGHRNADAACRKVLCSPGVVSFLNSHALFLGVSTSSAEGRRVSATLRLWGQPMLCTLMHHRNTPVCIDRMFVADGNTTADVVQARLLQLHGAQQATLLRQRHERHQIQQDRQIRAEQDRDYQEALRRDQLKEEDRQRERDAKEQRVRDKEDRLEAKQRKAEELRERRLLAGANLPAEPDASETDVVRLSIRLPDNTRLARAFHNHDSLALVRDFIFSNEQSPAVFSLQTSYPKRNLGIHGDSVGTIADAELGRAAMLIVKDEEVYESDSDESDGTVSSEEEK